MMHAMGPPEQRDVVQQAMLEVDHEIEPEHAEGELERLGPGEGREEPIPSARSRAASPTPSTGKRPRISIVSTTTNDRLTS